MRIDSWRPGPAHEWCLQMRHELWRLESALSRVEQDPTQLRWREPFPRHLERRQVPIGSARHPGGGLVGALVARAATQARRAVIIRPARDVRDVPVPVIALPRKAGARVAIHATRMMQNGQHLTKKRSGSRRAIGCRRIGRVRLHQQHPAHQYARPHTPPAACSSCWHDQHLTGPSERQAMLRRAPPCEFVRTSRSGRYW